MARITNFTPQSIIKPLWIWDLTSQVGPGKPNGRGDVQLVQALINEVKDRLQLVDPRKTKLTPLGAKGQPLAQLNEDGWWGPETAAAVQSYQMSLNNRFGSTSDGVVDPVHPLVGQLTGDPISGRVLGALQSIQRRMIFRLNADHLLFKGRMMDESEFPS